MVSSWRLLVTLTALSSTSLALTLPNSLASRGRNEFYTMEEKKWWKESVVYQVYPRSFQDSNGDGIGDLNGITSRLDYIKDLGANLVWICPMYKSPWSDYGYDIADYYTVADVFGTNEDLYNLIKEAKSKDIGVLLDLVINHTSDEHEWFQKALKDPESKYRDYYFFERGIDGKPPNNWRSYFGGSAWEPVPNEDNMFYLHAFTNKMPDLNWENAELKKELYTMINWWIGKGIAGFRIDAIMNIKKTMVRGTIPSDGDDGLVAIADYIINQPGIKNLLRDLKQNTFANHDIMTIAEAAVPDDELDDFIGPDGFFDMSFDFRAADIDIPASGDWYYPTNWTVNELRDILLNVQTSVQKAGWGATYFENHDQNRSINKYLARRREDISDTTKKLLGTILLGFRGTPVVFEGQEIGMENIQLDSINQYEDVATHNQYNAGIKLGIDRQKVFDMVSYRSRDNSRTPMQWDTSADAGFTTGKPWFPVNPNYKTINVAEAVENKKSVYHHYRDVIALRNGTEYKEVLVYGKTVQKFKEVDNVIAYERALEDRSILFFANFQNKTISLDKSGFNGRVLSNNYDDVVFKGGEVSVLPYQAFVIETKA
ncbi:putative alpha-glucosidase (maltase) [Fusarium austroafricanum]|uniref:Putative alpha-glucosidase (Maltase) n=1 Tax=Fusarium austroafricanum TaxID=2364996 RepID=A0A8H4KMU4_9HYPO|nr:putative alpha-glucosidase (maltase) [Fusarium austroafricanum]